MIDFKVCVCVCVMLWQFHAAPLIDDAAYLRLYLFIDTLTDTAAEPTQKVLTWAFGAQWV